MTLLRAGISLRQSLLGEVARRGAVTTFPPMPASLFAFGEEGAWYEPSPTTCFTDTAGTTPAGVGDTVARINDLSGNGHHATQATAAARPVLQQTAGGLWYLEFDGVDDFLEAPISTTETSYTALIGADQYDDKFSYFYQLNVDGTAQASLRGGPTPGYDGDLVLRGLGKSDLTYTNHTVGPKVITANQNSSDSFIRYNGAIVGGPASVDNAPIQKIGIGKRYDRDDFNFSGRIYGLVLRVDAVDAEKITATEQYLAAKSGVTL